MIERRFAIKSIRLNSVEATLFNLANFKFSRVTKPHLTFKMKRKTRRKKLNNLFF